MDIQDPKTVTLDRGWAFFFDIDGTLADIAPTPEEARIPESTIDDLLSLQKKAPVVLVSGRSIVSIDSLTRPAIFPAAGQHGLEIRFSPDHSFLAARDGSLITALVEKIKLFQLDHPGLIVEYKGLSVAVHYRMRPDLAGTVQTFLDSLIGSHEGALCRQHGKMVEEVRLRGANKGTAIEAFMKTPAFQGKVPIFAGDDLTDEDAHAVVNAMGGITIQIGTLSSAANFRMPTPRALRLWLNEIVTPEMVES